MPCWRSTQRACRHPCTGSPKSRRSHTQALRPSTRRAPRSSRNGSSPCPRWRSLPWVMGSSDAACGAYEIFTRLTRAKRMSAATAIAPLRSSPLTLSARRLGVNELLIHELLDAQRTELPADARALGTAERQFRAAALAPVDPHHAYLQPVSNLRGHGLVRGPD